MKNSSSTAPSECGLVYIHGAGLDTWIWEELTQKIDAPQLQVSFPGRGESSIALENLGLQEYVDHVRQQVEDWHVENVIVISHSIGGVIGLEVANDLSERIVGFVGICAAIPKSGDSFLSCYPFHQRIVRRILTRLAGTKPPESAIRRSLCAELSEEQTNRLIDQFTPESRKLFIEQSDAEIPDVSTLYVKTTNDVEFGPSLQDRMIENLKADEVVRIDTGHVPMLSRPQELAEIISQYKEIVSGTAPDTS